MRTRSILSITLLSLLLIFTSISCNPGINDDISRWEQRAENITIIRDNYGVPHIYGETDADAVFGMVYAQCEDDFNRVEVNYINAMGRMAEVEGEDLIYTDLRMKLYIDPVELKKEYDQSPMWLKDLMDAFADGANYYLHTHPEVKPKLITRFEPWMALAFSEGSIGGDIEKISVRGLKDFYGKDHDVEIASAGLPPDYEPRGSNGFAIAPSLNTNGNAMLLINPHTSFFFRSEVHMVSKEGLNAYGAVTWGQFFIYQGFNDKCGWMHTSTRADFMDFYEESIVEEDGKLFYVYGDEKKPVIEKAITVPYKDGEGMSEKTFTAYYTHRGPVVAGNSEDKWISVALMVEHEKALTQSYLRTKAQGYDDFMKTMDLHTNSSNNTVYADADGNIAYWHGNFMPVRNPEYDYSGLVDGSNPETDWQGLHTVDEMIHILNPGNGWIQNCNQTPFTACLEFSPKKEDYPAYMAPDAENPRGYHAVRVLTGAKDFTVDKLIEVAYDSYLPAFEKTIPALVNAFDELRRRDNSLKGLDGPANALRNWDTRYSVESVPTTLAVYWGQSILTKTRGLKVPFGLTNFDIIASDVDGKILVEALSEAVAKLTLDFGTWEVPWGDVNRYQRLNGDIRQPFNDDEPSEPVFFASSRWGSLASFGARTYPGTKKMYGTSGNSFVAAVEFGEKVSAKSILAGGISSDPDSPHFDDQVDMYINGKFKDVLYYRDDIEAKAERTYNPGK